MIIAACVPELIDAKSRILFIFPNADQMAIEDPDMIAENQ